MVMSVEKDHRYEYGEADVSLRSRKAWERAESRLRGAVEDFHVPADARFDDRTRAELGERLRALVGGIEAGLRRTAARVLAARDAARAAEDILERRRDTVARLAFAGLLRDFDLMDELVAQIRHDHVAQALPISAFDGIRPGLLVRLMGVADPVIAGAARALRTAEVRRAEPANLTVLPAELHHRLVWWVAAAIRDGRRNPDADRALVEAAERMLAAHDEGQRMEAIADRLASAIDAEGGEIATLLIEALGDRLLVLFVAVLAHAIALDHDQVRAMTIEPDDERLLLALRSAGLDRTAMAQVALSLAEADPRRDIYAFADSIDMVARMTPQEARDGIAIFALHPEMRAAMRALAHVTRR
jgi:hypothetical protein